MYKIVQIITAVEAPLNPQMCKRTTNLILSHEKIIFVKKVRNT
jgi:hypothetical protein